MAAVVSGRCGLYELSERKRVGRDRKGARIEMVMRRKMAVRKM